MRTIIVLNYLLPFTIFIFTGKETTLYMYALMISFQMGRILLQTKLSCFLILFELSKIGLKIYHQKQYNCFHTLYRLRLEKQYSQ
jgi:hypothetical protein